MTLYKYGKLFYVLMCFTTYFGAEIRESLETLDYTERETIAGKMTSSFLKGNRTIYRNLLEKELEKGKNLISKAEQEEYEVKIYCLRRLNHFIEKLEQTNERLSVAIEGQEGAQEMEALMNDDWSCIAEVTDCRDELVDIQQSLQDQKPPSENWSSITVTEDRFNQMIQMTAQMQQVMIGQQQMQQQQQQSRIVKSQAVFNR